jgi:predicted PurR-regulated permease PerM
LGPAASSDPRDHPGDPALSTQRRGWRLPTLQDSSSVKLSKLWRRHDAAPASPSSAAQDTPQVVQIDLDEDQLRQMSAVFAAPRWMRDLGIAAWLLVGIFLLFAGSVGLLAVTAAITTPVITGLILATVASPIVARLQAKGVHRALGAAIVLLGIVALAALITLMVIGGIVSQESEIKAGLNSAADTVESWLNDAGVDSSGASTANEQTSESVSAMLSTFVSGLSGFIGALTGIAFFVVFTTFAVFFLLKDGPSTRGWIDGHLGVPIEVARTITGDVITSLRRYFYGLTIVAAFNAVVVGVGAWILGVPLAGTIAVVTFVLAYIPFIGAFVSGAFAVLIALGSEGTTTAAIMLVIVLLANGLLQNIVQPIAFGATLRMNPLLVLIATIGFGSIFGMLGLILGAPLTSAAIHIFGDLGEARANVATAEEETAAPEESRPPPDEGEHWLAPS